MRARLREALLAALLVVGPGLPAAGADAARQLAGSRRQPGEIQTPGEIQQPKGTWQIPGDIQQPKGIQAIAVTSAACDKRMTIGGDTLFEFDKATLTADAEETLGALGPLILKEGNHPASIEGHTDSIGSAAYNKRLSEQRAATVKTWLVAHLFLPAATPILGRGESQPAAPNAKPDGTDDPDGRRLNRRVVVAIDACGWGRAGAPGPLSASQGRPCCLY